MFKTKKPKTRSSSRKGVWLIAIFKLFKGLILLAVGIGVLSLLHENAAERVTHWIAALRVDPNNHFIHMAIRKLWSVDDKKLAEISAGTFFYAALMLTEGLGLALRKRWAEYFTIFVTGSFIPLEVYELAQQFSLTKIAVIAINVAVVVYLAIGLRQPGQ
ncbi:MAG: DUF2127 domain-containing protein [Acidobacteriota bacterium]|nr:DUF2127 domain-containing protein [Acidobacteriota bacterium]